MSKKLGTLRDIGQQFRLLGNFISLVYRRFREERCFQLCGSLTFTTLLALVPLVTIALTVMTAFPVFAGVTETLREFIVRNLVPQAGTRVVTVYVQQFAGNAARLTAAGVTLLAAAAIMLMLTIDRAFNTIWRVKRPRPLVQRVLIYWSLLTVGPLLVGGSLTLWSWLLTVSLNASAAIPALTIAVLRIVPIALTAIAFGLLYRLVPNRQVSVLDASVGGIIAAMAFEGMKVGFGEFITHVSNYKLVYGAFASLPIFLMWVYLSWVTVVFAAVITAVLPYWRTGGVKFEGAPGSEFVDALEIMALLARAHLNGEVRNLQQMRAVVKLAWEDMESILDRLERAGWVAKLQGNGWVLARDANRIYVIDIYRRFVFSEDAGLATDEQLLRSLATRIARNTEDVVDMTLEQLLFGRESGRGASSRAA